MYDDHYEPFTQNHGEQSVGAQLRQQRQALLQLVLALPLVGDVAQAALRVPEAVELGVLVVEVHLVFHLVQTKDRRRKIVKESEISAGQQEWTLCKRQKRRENGK